MTRTTLFAASLGLAGQALAAPVPKADPTHWELDFKFHDPQRIVVTLPGESTPTTFWYVLYTVTNNSGKDVQFYPSFDVVTDTLKVTEGGAHISPRVQVAIRDRHKLDYPFFVEPTKVTGKLLQGEDNARTSCAIFRDFDPEASRFTVYVSGLSGEMSRSPNPTYDPSKPETDENPKFFPLRKTLAITYTLPGDARSRHGATPIRVSREWVMR